MASNGAPSSAGTAAVPMFAPSNPVSYFCTASILRALTSFQTSIEMTFGASHGVTTFDEI
jgi:hypothetical protein